MDTQDQRIAEQDRIIQALLATLGASLDGGRGRRDTGGDAGEADCRASRSSSSAGAAALLAVGWQQGGISSAAEDAGGKGRAR